MTPLEERIITFANGRLRRDMPSRIRKLAEEFGELFEAIIHGDHSNASVEAADMAIILTDIVNLLSGGRQSLSELMESKLGVCERRTYVNGSRVRVICVQCRFDLPENYYVYEAHNSETGEVVKPLCADCVSAAKASKYLRLPWKLVGPLRQ